ncbi:hypothetical protein GJA_288 [Janthinobacterium agaricidamnosum NBRC 102515 = DSM 9628]|uniref:Uncharacterized protein n=1 Tax=Janthinobacterium agaricidamnosum NBRC 102515 = DSM 9628 TaxID=1349767 RepID=W0UWX1_9BURK|nr:hypothetical protein GJA_288 [Janthinobacterium agaricidamnosum NBRC 102515 = DSM 9628]
MRDGGDRYPRAPSHITHRCHIHLQHSKTSILRQAASSI